mgnify:CR=1 FL=1
MDFLRKWGSGCDFFSGAGIKAAKALLPIPSFYEYRQALESVGCQISEILLKEDEAFCLQKRFVNEIPMDTDMVCLCNPNNPTGQLIDREVLEQVADYCQKTDTCLLLDECFMIFWKRAVCIHCCRG